jgi:S-adenosylmethionine:tRNA ribosyltransferase-isomerase
LSAALYLRAVKVSQFDYALPEELIAQEPLPERDASRLLVVPRGGGPLAHARFADLERLLSPGDLLVMNDARVLPARLVGRKASGGRCELLLVEPLAPGAAGAGRWRAMGQSSKALRPGTRLAFGELSAAVEEVEGEGFLTVAFDRGGRELEGALEREGRMPLPPYIRREPSALDRERYQTVVARAPGSAAAPTAGLHFTERLLARLEARGVARTTITLHVGPGTFLPVRVEEVAQHRMHEERYRVPDGAARAFSEARSRGSRVVAVGTTALRTLESAFEKGGLRPGEGRTNLFVTPGYHFRAVDALVTNLHLPRSTLLMLVCAFGGYGPVLHAYSEAVRERYRFFSYGDAMFLG